MKAKNNSGTAKSPLRDILVIFLTAALTTVIFLCSKPLRNYLKAEYYLLSGQYREAQTLFESIDRTGSSSIVQSQKQKAMYWRAVTAAGENNKWIAMDLFYRLGDYRNSRQAFEGLADAYVESYAEVSNYEPAFDFLAVYSGNEHMQELDRELHLRRANELLDVHKFDAAREEFEKLKEYYDVEASLIKADYMKACSLIRECRYEEALPILESLGSYENVPALTKAVIRAQETDVIYKRPDTANHRYYYLWYHTAVDPEKASCFLTAQEGVTFSSADNIFSGRNFVGKAGDHRTDLRWTKDERYELRMGDARGGYNPNPVISEGREFLGRITERESHEWSLVTSIEEEAAAIKSLRQFMYRDLAGDGCMEFSEYVAENDTEYPLVRHVCSVRDCPDLCYSEKPEEIRGKRQYLCTWHKERIDLY